MGLTTPIALAALLAGACGGGGGGARKHTAAGDTPPTPSRPAPSIAMKPYGTGWFCTTTGSCFRDEKVCKDTLAETTKVYGPCTAQRTAFCYTLLDGFGYSAVCSPTMYGCDRDANHWASAEASAPPRPRTVSTCAEWD